MNSDLKVLRHFTAWYVFVKKKQALFTRLRSSLSTHSKDRWSPFHLIRGQSFIFLPRFTSPFKHSLLVLTWEVQYESFMSAWCLDGAINSGTLRPERCLHRNLRKKNTLITSPHPFIYYFFYFSYQCFGRDTKLPNERVSDRVRKWNPPWVLASK